MSRIYLDHAATTPLLSSAKQAMMGALDVLGNPSSIHQEGQEAKSLIEEARRQVAHVLDVRSETIVFTSGGTEANNLALRGVMAANSGKRLLTTGLEHACVLEIAKYLQENGTAATLLGVNDQGQVLLDVLEEELAKGDVALVSIHHINNESGVVQDIAAIAQLAHRYGALCHTDAVQSFGHAAFKWADLGVDMMTVSAHKIGGPKGVGALIVSNALEGRVHAQLSGGGQERKRRSGTENVAGIVGFGAAMASLDISFEFEKNVQLKQQLLAGLAELPVNVVAANAPTAPHITQVIVPHVKGEDLVIAMDMAGFAISQGAACSSGRSGASQALMALGYDEETARCAVRISFGWTTTEQDVQAFLSAFAEIVNRFKQAA